MPLSELLRLCAAGHREDSLLERAFWSAVTLSPPLYGADTPQSFFDAKLEWGWNLRKLECLLSNRAVPKIPGVNTPMTYFGMWKVRSMPHPPGVFYLKVSESCHAPSEILPSSAPELRDSY